MPFPAAQELRKPLLDSFRDGFPHNYVINDLFGIIANYIGENPNEMSSGDKNILKERVKTARDELKQNGLISSPAKNTYMITNAGLEILRDDPAIIDDEYLKNFRNRGNSIKEDEPEIESEIEPEPVIELESESESQEIPVVPELESDLESESESESDSQEIPLMPELDSDLESESELEIESESEPESEIEIIDEPLEDEELEPLELDSESEPEIELESESESDSNLESEEIAYMPDPEDESQESQEIQQESQEQEQEESEILPQPVINESDPEKSLESVIEKFNSDLAEEILNKITELHSDKFEQLVIDLLSKMGYRAFHNARYTTEALSNSDDCIHGVILESEPGLNPIYIQARKLSPSKTVNKNDIQEFIDALKDKGGKGLFATTANFSEQAADFARASKIMLIDGNRLANLMISSNFCVSIEKIVEIKSFDSESFSDYEN